MLKMNAIEIRNLSKSFRGLYALDGLNMTVPVGAIYGFIGENGSGKSTTEKLICGHLVPDSGEIRLFGRDYTDPGVRVRVGALMLILYFAGAVLGGAISGLSFDLHGLTYANLAMCMLAKIFLMPVFISIFVLVSVAAKQKAWLSICGSLGGGMLLFMMVGMITPLSSTFIHVALCLAVGVLFAIGLGTGSKQILKKTSLV
jgi:ABC-type cobalamin/Fe3+-siderophores transport system ATPase subunit